MHEKHSLQVAGFKTGFLISLLLVSTLAMGCLWPSIPNRSFKRPDDSSPVTMFDRYRLHMYGSADSSSMDCFFQCDVDFIERVAADTPFDSVPVFVIDSLCFTGSCLSPGSCRVPINYKEWDQLQMRKGTLNQIETSGPNDINWDKDHIWPMGFIVLPSIPLPLACSGGEVTVEIVARLYDRVTGSEIGREVKQVPFLIKRGKRYLSR